MNRTRGTDLATAFMFLSFAACGEQRVTFFDADGGATDSGVSDTLAVDVSDRDPERCGAAARHCEDDEYCVAGVCVCRQGLVEIGGRCRDTRADPENCGGEGIVCPSVCIDGTCGLTCLAGTEQCDGGCVNVSAHPLHCGECGRPCGSGRVCTDGLCEPFRPASCAACPCALCGTRTCCSYPGTADPICLDASACAVDF